MRFANLMAPWGGGDPRALVPPDPEEAMSPEEQMAEAIRNAEAISADLAKHAQRKAQCQVVPTST